MALTSVFLIMLAVILGAAPSQLADLLPPGAERCIFGRVTEIPDGDGGGIRIGPIEFQDDKPEIDGICLALDIHHEFIADLHIELGYDLDCDGELDAVAPLELYQARPGSHDAEAEYAYYFELDGIYFFRDDKTDGTEKLDLDQGGEASSCAAGEPIRSFSVFRGLPTGGDFYLSVVDSLASKTGVLRDWAVGPKS